MQALGWRSKSFNRCFSPTVGESSSSTPSISGYRPPARNCIRLVILGSSKVGKSAIVSRFLSNRFEDNYTPTIEDFHRKLYRIRGEVYQLDILDTSGNHPFPAMRRLSFLTAFLMDFDGFS
uniref:Dexamethasone-induced Ras-related protein 1 n=1 Tax=Strigamia maritima TaxID=126957 RepID=T1IYA5_STRMM